MGIISKKTTKFLLSKDKRGYTDISRKYGDIVDKSIAGIEKLTEIAQNLPEERQKDVFSKNTLEPMIKAILRPDDIDENSQRRLEIAAMLAITGLKMFHNYVVVQSQEHIVPVGRMTEPVINWLKMMNIKIKNDSNLAS